MSLRAIDDDEETALLPDNVKSKRLPTPLPKFQISIVLLLQICEPLTSQSIYPYINQLISELDITGGDERRVGYYAGLIESLFFVTEAITVLQWSRVSDFIGRKPVLLIGFLGTTISMLCFGLSRTFWALVVSRCLTGLLNGNIGVMKSVMGDLTDSSNRAEGFALMPVVWAFGATFGPLMGGTFARPHERFPKIFTGSFWKEYPYFMPCVATASFVMVSFLVTLFFFKETVPKRKESNQILYAQSTEHHRPLDGPQMAPLSPSRSRDDPLPLRDLLTFPVLISISNYVALAFLNIAFSALFPLFLAMPIEIGGLDLPPATIGYIMGAYGAGTGLFQFFFFAKIIRRLGERQIFINGMIAFAPLFALFPIINIIARQSGLSIVVWSGIAIICVLATVMDMSYGAIFMYVTASSPNRSSLGATNGLSQTTVSIARAIGPALSTSLFSLSVEHNYLGGYAVYLVFGILSILALFLAVRLPHDLWEEESDDE